MCLILFAVNPNDRYRLIVAANRDEFYSRPTRAAGYWNDHPDVLAGRDREMGGTWLGVNRSGRFSAVTNFGEQPPDPIPPRSRGELPANFLINNPEPETYLEQIASRGREYRGFNLIVADDRGCRYYGNRAGHPKPLTRGCYGLSNRLLDCDWPKVVDGRQRLASLVQSFDHASDDLMEALFGLLMHTGDDREFSNSFIAADTYGTRAATVVMIEQGGNVHFEERNFGENGTPLDSNRFRFRCNDDS